MAKTVHPNDPRSNIAKFSGYDPEKYVISNVPPTVLTDECLTPGRPPCLTQRTIGKYLVPTTMELSEVAPVPTISELPDAVIDEMVKKDKAFWVDKPGANAYTLHDAYYNYGMTTEVIKPTPQHVFPRSYQYDLDCVRYRRLHACDGLTDKKVMTTNCLVSTFYANDDGDNQIKKSMLNGTLALSLVYRTRDPSQVPVEGTALPEVKNIARDMKAIRAHCRDCRQLHILPLTPFQLAWAKDPGQKRWKYYPDLTATLSPQQIRSSMDSVGRPFRNEACNWYYTNYPPVKYDCILRKFSQ